ncbi:MFS transporter [Actinomycetes bacterium KLBMP 9759]
MEPTRQVVRQVGLGQAAVGFTINSLGVCLVLLARDLDTVPAELIWLSSSFGLGLLVVGAAGRLILRVGPHRALSGAAVVAAVGVALLGAAVNAGAAAAGALLLGLGAAGLVLVTPALLRGPGAAAQLARVNAVASTTGVLGPLALGALDSAGVTGRLALLVAVPPLLVLAVGAGRGDTSAAPEPVEAAPSRRAVGGAWIALVLAVSIEFCFTIWAGARLQATGLPPAAAVAAVSVFLVGMASGRFAAPWLIRRGLAMVPLSVAATIAGTLLVALPPAPALVVVGLGVAGVGVAALYPVCLARLVHVPGLTAARSAAYGALASGTAILAAPAVLVAVGEAVDLRTAYLVTVLPLAVLLLVVGRLPVRRASGELSRRGR